MWSIHISVSPELRTPLVERLARAQPASCAARRDTVGTVGTAGAPWGLVALALLVVYVVWGSTYLGIRIVVEEAPPLVTMGQRFLLAGLLLAGGLALRSGPARLRVTRRQLAGCALLGLLLPMLGNGLVSVAEAHGATSGYTALLIAVAPLAIVVFRTVEHDRPRAMTTVGVLTGFAGLALLVVLGRGGGEATPSARPCWCSSPASAGRWAPTSSPGCGCRRTPSWSRSTRWCSAG